MIDFLGNNILMIGAHADDIEIGCGGAAGKLLSLGAQVVGLVITDTHYVRDGVVHRDAETSKREAIEAAGVIGYEVHFGNIRNNDVKVNSDLVYFIRGFVEQFDIQTVFTHWDGDAHLDHRNVALATMMATRDPRNLIMYRTNHYISPSAFSPNFLIDTSDHFEKKMEAIACFKAELERGGDSYFDWIRHANKASGATANVEYAEEFCIVKSYK